MYLTGLVLRSCLIASTLAVPAREMADTQLVEADEEMDNALWSEPTATGVGPRDAPVPIETRTAPTETIYAGTSASIELETSTLPTETVYAPTTPTSTTPQRTPTPNPLGDLNENPDNKNTEPIIGNPQDPNNNAISPYRPHEAASPTSVPPDRVSVTLGVPTHTLYPNGTEFRQVKWLNYCHAHRRPLFYTFRVVGQLWGGKNITASQFWNVVNTCGQQSGNYFIDAENENFAWYAKWHSPLGTKACLNQHIQQDLGAPTDMVKCTTHYDRKAWNMAFSEDNPPVPPVDD